MAGINLVSKLPVLSQAGQMLVRAGREEPGVRIRREGNRDMGGCEVALRLLFVTPKPYQGQD